MKQIDKVNATAKYYRGFCITYIRNEWRAEAYGNPQFCNTNMKKLKDQINTYLNRGKN